MRTEYFLIKDYDEILTELKITLSKMRDDLISTDLLWI